MIYVNATTLTHFNLLSGLHLMQKTGIQNYIEPTVTFIIFPKNLFLTVYVDPETFDKERLPEELLRFSSSFLVGGVE